MRSPTITFAASRQGSVATEFAILVMPLLLLLFGVIEIGRLLWTRDGMAQAAAAGARCMGLGQLECVTNGSYSATGTQAFIQSKALGWGIPLATSNIVLNRSATCGQQTDFSQVTLSYTFTSLVPTLLTNFTSTALTASACYPNNP